ncbi:MAG: hypothetical protein AB4063_19650 [Crocosphaera sp.]
MKLAEILERLKQPVPKHLLSVKEKKSKKTGKVARIPYLPVWEYYQLLDERCNPENWELSLEVTQTGGLTVAIASLTIHGEDRSITRQATGNENSDFEGYGDSTSNATAQAVRRVCGVFGLSRELWLKKPVSSPQLPNIPKTQQKGTISREEWLRRKAQANQA